MNGQIIRAAISEEADALVPNLVNLWPGITARWAARQRIRTTLRLVRRAAAVALLVIMLVLAVSPSLRAAFAELIQQVIRVSGRAGEPTSFMPTPPFVVRQPNYLPSGFVQARTIYNPGFDPQAVQAIPTVQPVPSQIAPSSEVNRLLAQVDKYSDPSQAAILIIYRAGELGELWLYERAALFREVLPAGTAMTVNGQDAVLVTDGQQLTLTWIEDGTWLMLRGTLTREELLRVAKSLVVTSVPSAGETAGSGVPGPMVDLQVATPNPTNASIWSFDPKLGEVPGQIYYGHVVIEVWDKGETMFFGPTDENGNIAGNLTHADLFGRVITALGDPQTPILTETPWADDPVMGPQPGMRYMGRVIVDIWEKQVTIAISGPEPISVLAQRAMQRLQSELKP